MNNEKFIHIDLFTGIGGFSLGLKQANFPISKTYFSEIDKYAITVYRRNFPDAEYIGGVESISGARFKGRKTIITFGFPCQDLSIAGKRRGFDGSRSSLFFEAMRIIEEVRPDIFIFENVKGFYSSNNGKDFQIALQTIADIGLYECEWQLLNTAWFLPQNRERIYFVGHFGEGSGRKIFPIRENARLFNRKVRTRQGRAQTEISTTIRGSNIKADNTFVVVAQRGRNPENPKSRKAGLLTKQMFEERTDGLTNTLTSVQKDNYLKMKVANSVTPDAYLTTGACKRNKNGKAILTSMWERRIRRLTPIECERLQGFPYNWTKYGHEGQVISDSQRYKMLGNAVSVPVVKCIGDRLNKGKTNENN